MTSRYARAKCSFVLGPQSNRGRVSFRTRPSWFSGPASGVGLHTTPLVLSKLRSILIRIFIRIHHSHLPPLPFSIGTILYIIMASKESLSRNKRPAILAATAIVLVFILLSWGRITDLNHCLCHYHPQIIATTKNININATVSSSSSPVDNGQSIIPQKNGHAIPGM